MKETTPIYVQLQYSEALESKKEILSSEVNLINLIKTIKRYQTLRQEELKVKSSINKAIKELKAKTKEMQVAFPFMKLPEKVSIPRKEEDYSSSQRKGSDNLEVELKKIQAKLKEIGRG